MQPTIIYQDENILALNKPSGLVVHPTGGVDGGTLVDWVLEQYPHMEGVGEPLALSSGKVIQRAGLLHRLDKDTSGIILFAKNQDTFLFFKKQFQDREVKKEYRAIVYGVIKSHHGVIDVPIGRSTKQFNMRGVGKSAQGISRSAITEYQLLSQNEKFSYLSVFPKTGRTHQIRVHLKSIGHPVLCDALYGDRRECPKEMGRLALHALSIEVQSEDGKVLKLSTPIPQDMEGFIAMQFA